jgi:ketosteroid isomerase-like protein
MDLRAHADAWMAAWKARDIDAVMACYADNIDFVAATVARRWGQARWPTVR